MLTRFLYSIFGDVFSYIKRLKKTTVHATSARTKSFWPFFVAEGGRRLGLITAQEDTFDDSNVEDEEADQVSLVPPPDPVWQ